MDTGIFVCYWWAGKMLSMRLETRNIFQKIKIRIIKENSSPSSVCIFKGARKQTSKRLQLLCALSYYS